jgi:hypothetical protein
MFKVVLINPWNYSIQPQWTYMDFIKPSRGFGYRADLNETFFAKSKGKYFSKR